MRAKAKNQDSLLEAILPLVKEQRRLARIAERQFSAEVDAIIREHSRSSSRIENLLDRMLDFGFDEGTLRLYKKLCRYYLVINPRATAFYVHAYRDMWEEA